MNNDTNNEINGTVIGNVDNNLNSTNFGSANNVSEEVETLDVGPIVNDNVNQNPIQEQQSSFFTNPPINEMEKNNVELTANVVNDPPQPMPAYTNPQTINPMPGFENPNTIGTTPPISFEKEKKPKKKGSKILFVLLILLAMVGVGFGTFYVLKYTDLIKKEAAISINVKELVLNVGDALSTNINDYASINGTDTKNCSLDTSSVDVTKTGKYEFTIKCGEIQKIGNITIIDNRDLIVETKKVYKVKGDTVDVNEFIKTIDVNITYEFVEPELVNNLLQGEKGSYKVKIKASNGSKDIEVEGNLIILEHSIRGYLTCTSKEQSVDGTSAKMKVSEKFAILNDGNNGFGGITEEIHTFKFSDETEYTNYLATYKTSNTVNINNITGDATFDDNALTITISKDRDSESVINEYGANNMEKYQTIRTYFINNLKYDCTYKNNG